MRAAVWGAGCGVSGRRAAQAAILAAAAAAAAAAAGAVAAQAPATPTCAPLPVARVLGAGRVERAGLRLVPGTPLATGDRIVVGRRSALSASLGGAGFRFSRSAFTVGCRASAETAGPGTPSFLVDRGRVRLSAPARGERAAAVGTPDALAHALRGRSRFTVERDFRGRRTMVAVARGRVAVVSARDARWAFPAPPGPPVVVPRRSVPRPVTWPLPLSPDQRSVPARDLPRFWSDGRSCSAGCRPGGAVSGWPLRPFRRQHALRAGLNEKRPANFHLGIDIQARDGQPVYAMQAGTAHVIKASGDDERVQVGSYVYWHIRHRVGEGQHVRVHQFVGKVKRGFGHLHLSEVDSGGRYLNPLRPGGRVLSPWRDDAAPVVGVPQLGRHGRVTVEAFDPQSFQARTTYWTPVLAPAALAYRLVTKGGRRIGPLRWALRGSQNLPNGLKRRVFARGARKATFTCFRRREVCVPRWRYRLAGGLAPPLDRGALAPGSYRLIAYAWDWAGNVGARDAAFTVGRSAGSGDGAAPAWSPPRIGPPPRARPSDRG